VEEEQSKGQQVIVQLVVDEMAIRYVQFDGKKFIGKVTNIFMMLPLYIYTSIKKFIACHFSTGFEGQL
jgi:hypothetical protein